jgi:hypothetical protein
MSCSAFRTLAVMLSACAISSATLSHAGCPIDEVIVSGRVEDAPVNGSSIRVQLVYANHKAADSAEATLDRGSFRIQIPFLTQSRAPVLIGSLREKCDRKPETVVVTLVEGDQEYDRSSLELARDFKKTDSTTYTVRSEIVLHGPTRTPAIR